MNTLTVLTLLNCVLLLIYFFNGKTKKLSYTETIIARGLGAYIFTLVALIVICLMVLKEKNGILVMAYIINIVLTSTFLIVFIAQVGRSK